MGHKLPILPLGDLYVRSPGEEEPFGSGEDLGLFWNVAVSNNKEPSGLRELAQGGVLQIPLELGGLLLSMTGSLKTGLLKPLL